MKATDLLKAQHDEVKADFKSLERAQPRRTRDQLLAKIANKLVAHMVMEQEIFYPACAERLQDKSIVAEAFEEHGIASVQLARTLGSTGTDATFEAKTKVLKELIEHHIEEEEKVLFPKVRKLFDAEELQDLGEQMEMRFERQLEEGYKRVLASPPPDAREALVGTRAATKAPSRPRRIAARGGATKRAKR